MAWEWLTAGVVPGISVLASTGLAVWSQRLQRQSTDLQLAEQRELARDAQRHELQSRREERMWDSRVSMLRTLNDLGRKTIQIVAVEQGMDAIEQMLAVSGQVSGELRTEVELWGSEELIDSNRKFFSALTVVIQSCLEDPRLEPSRRDMAQAQNDTNEGEFLIAKHENEAMHTVIWREKRDALTHSGDVGKALSKMRAAIHAETRPS